MKVRALKRVPGIIGGGVIALVCLAQALPRWWPGFDAFQRLEWMTYDWRVRQALGRGGPETTSLNAVFIDDDSLKLFNERFGFQFPWPRQLYGRAVKNLTCLGVKAIGFDILFRELETSNPRTEVRMPDGSTLTSDEFFARQLRDSSNVVLAVFGETVGGQWQALAPADLFRTNAWALGHAGSDRDSDGVLRRAKAYKEDAKLGRIWHLGIVLAARELGLDLTQAVIRPGQILLRGPAGVAREIPVDRDGFFYIDWSLAWNDKRLGMAEFEAVAGFQAIGGEPRDWSDKLVVIGSIGTGNNITDMGATPLSKETYLVSKHWNVAQSVISGRFVRPASDSIGLLLVVVLGLGSALLTWNLRPPWPSVAVVSLAAGFVILALWLYIDFRFWLPIVLPVGGGLLLTHMGLTTYQILFEQKEKQRVRSMFAKLVSPNVVSELLQTERLDLAGTRRDITVLFADVRGFTEMTDTVQATAEAYAREHKLEGKVAEEFVNQRAQMTLETVNAYLSVVADQVKKHEGTLDKYIGDCVMAFWGAPTANGQHAAACVRAAVDAQRAIDRLNRERAAQNQQREKETAIRLAAGQLPLPMLPLLALGTGINTGLAIVGLMGSEAHILNYTVFGREVNLASRLEGASGSSRILISQATYAHLLRDDPALAATCVELSPVVVKGIRSPVRVYEVPWRPRPPGAGGGIQQTSPTPTS